ncbi:Hypothetical protein LUCI_0127 [Lucifera butyrica]|uniref:HTH lacI-type domain-containing protein n=1 Tax=Lucifera butyrica TaxID=1351585 RepID=A0A498R0T0_9FIRM|nr:LacI family DNA-binding transcriptional regulator [Lucifera butyrica]VBB04921.1 Hypothetical protein LUCI_0127 [Lucifera butyrica]
MGVSQATVSRALNNSSLITEGKKKYIQQKAAEYGFVLNSQAQSLKTNRTGTVGILFPKHYDSMNHNLLLAHMYDLIQQELINYGYDIMAIYDNENCHNMNNGISTFERVIRGRKVDGVIVLRVGGVTQREMELLRYYNTPCVCMLLPAQNTNFVNYFTSDTEYSAFVAGTYLGKFKNYLPILLISKIKDEMAETNRRIAGFRRGLFEAGGTLPDKNIMTCDLSIESAYNYVVANQDFFKRQKIAIFVSSDVMALGVCNAMISIGLKMPEDVQVLGTDDVPMAGWLHPRLSTMHIPVENIIPRGCSVLRQLIEGEENQNLNEIFKPYLVIRDTTLPV